MGWPGYGGTLNHIDSDAFGHHSLGMEAKL
jgi:hypothetical protein